MDNYEARMAVLKEAEGWIGTPYVPHGQVKGKNGGVDCLTFVAGVFAHAGVIDPLPIPHYPPDWHLHQTAEHYLVGKEDTPGLLHFCNEIELPELLPADIVVWKFGHCYAHAAIVMEWPLVIHAWAGRPVGPEDAMRFGVLTTIHEVRALRGQPRPRRYFTVKDWRNVAVRST